MAEGEMRPENRRVALAGLAAHPRNYNAHPALQVERLTASLRKFGQVRSIVVWRSMILAGHGVVEAARALGWREIAADVLPDEYPEHLALAYVAADNELARLGEPDHAQLAAILQESAAADAELLAAAGYDEAALRELLETAAGEAAGANGDTPYSRKIESPVYTPKGDKPAVDVLFDDAKTAALIRDIEAAEGLTEGERRFLIVAAQRHTVLHFNKIADFYAHSGAEVQRLMEDSALVIIDFNRAIELGYVRLAEQIAELYGRDYGGE